MGLADQFQQIVDAQPDDWSDLELDLRIYDETQYVEAAMALVLCNAVPYSEKEWHWRLLVAHRFGHAASVGAVRSSLKLLDEGQIAGEIALRAVRQGQVPVEPQWGRPESVREERRRINAQ